MSTRKGLHNRLGLRAAVSLGLVIVCGHGEAQSTGASDKRAEAGDSSGPQLGEIVVTAQRREQRLSDVGMTITAVDGSLLKERNLTSAEDLTQVVPALSVADNPDGTPVYTLRGVGFNSTNLGAQPTVSTYYDEAPLPYGPMTQGPLFDLERVEVLKGPQGTLYGQNSTGGAINFITAKPTDVFTSGVNLSYARFNTFQGGGYISGPVTSSLNARLAVSGTDSGDWQKSYTRDDTIGAQKKVAARLLLDWKPNDAIRGTFNINGWLDKSDNEAAQFVVAVPRVPAHALPTLLAYLPAPPNDRAADWDPGVAFDRNNRQWQTVGRFDINLPNEFRLTSLSNYVRVTIDSRYDNDGTALNLADVTTTGVVDVFTQEIRLARDIGHGRGNFLVGANYQIDHDHEGSFQLFDGLSSTVDVSSPPLPPPGLGTITQSENRGIQSNKTTGVFGNLEWNLTGQLTALAGARFTNAQHYNQSCTADTGNGDWAHVANGLIGLLSGTPGTLKPGDCVTLASNFTAPFTQESFSENNVSWRAGLNYKPEKDSLIYGLISRGFKAGNYPIINAISESSLAPVKQEELTSYEVGAKTRVSDLLRVDGAFYYYDYKNKQLLTNTNDPIFGLVPVLGNVPTAHAYGTDIGVTVTPMRGLTVQSAMNYEQTRIGPATGYDVFSNLVQLDGKSFNYAPNLTVTGDAEYRFDIPGPLQMFFGANLTHDGATYGDLAESAALRLKAYTTIGIRAGIASSGHWETMIWGQNIFNEYYWTNAALGYDGLYRLAGHPPTFGANVSYKFW
jgi:iron complex outermembrane receptor protein